MSQEPAAPEGTSPKDEAVPGDRTIAPIAGRLGGGPGGKAILLAALVVSCAAFLWATWDRGQEAPPKRVEPARQVVPFEAGPGIAEAASAPPTLANPGPNPPTLTDAQSEVPALDPGPEPIASASGSRSPPQPRESRTPRLLVYSRPTDRQEMTPNGPTLSESRPPTELETLGRTSAISRLRAGRLPDRNFLIVAGANLPCILTTALESTTPGHVACTIPIDILSDNGAVVLLEKGSRVFGEYRSGMRQGQSRLFVLWTRAVSPTGVVVTLASPAADALGRAGFDGEVDGHFWARFGGALMLSLVDDAAYAALGEVDSPGRVRLPSDAASVALQGANAIGPTLRKAPGGEVSIFVAHDLDFSAVYALRSRP